MSVLTPHAPELAQRLDLEMEEVESRFRAELDSDLPCVRRLVKHVDRYRGKRLRPMLVLLSGMAASPTGRDLTEAHRVVSCVVEMVHMATLVHDDVLDDAQVRRRGATVNHLHGNETAVMLGDYLISHAYHLCSSLPGTEVSRAIARITNVVCEGELLQLANRENWSLDQPTYFEIIRRKTASLCGVCCQMGAMLHEQRDPALGPALYRYGENLGVAFQIIDDLLDLTGDEQTVGKSVGRDLEKGKLTLPLILHAAGLSEEERQAFVDRLRQGSASGDAVSREVTASGSVQASRAVAQQLVDQAIAAAEELPASDARRAMVAVAGAVVHRSA